MQRPNTPRLLCWICMFLAVVSLTAAAAPPDEGASCLPVPLAAIHPLVLLSAAIVAILAVVVLLVRHLLVRRRLRRESSVQTSSPAEMVEEVRRACISLVHAAGGRMMLIDREFRVIWSGDSDDGPPARPMSPRDETCHQCCCDGDEACAKCPAARAFSSGQLEVSEVKVSSTGGDKRWYRVAAVPLRKEAGHVREVAVLSHDVTQHHVLRQQLLWSDKLSSVGELLAGVAHELNNPLAAVLGFSELLLAGDVPGGIREDLTRIQQEAVRCKRVVRNLLSFARHTPFEKRFVSVNELVATALELKSYQLRVDNITVHREFSDGLPATVADGQELQQVFLNVINNAHDAIREKGEPGTLTVRTHFTDERIVVEFTDTGTGIAPENLRRIFDPFFTTKRLGKGTGLGLSLARGIVTEHGGDIHVVSAVGKGTTFTVELPVVQVEEDAGAGEPEVPKRASEGRSLDVLVVDDESAMVELISGLLTLEGHRVTTTTDGREALGLIERHIDRFDLIITDLKMPGVSGEQLHHRVCELSPEFAGSIIFTTGDTANADTRRLLELTGNTVLEKPFGLEDLRQVIDTTMTHVH